MTMQKRSFSLHGHRTSVALEQEFWAALERLAAERRQSLARLISDADATLRPEQAARAQGAAQIRSLASVLRVLALTAAQSRVDNGQGD